jgi:nucleotide-binding universal stress UspA family protein
MSDMTESQRNASTDPAPAATVRAVVGYDGSPPASRALDAAVRLLQGRRGVIEVVYVAHLAAIDMLSADAIVQVEADFDDIEKELRASAASQLNGRAAWTFQRRQGIIAEQLIAATSAILGAHPGDTVVIVVGSSSHASHRVMGSVAVSLARHCPVPVVIVP